MNDLNNPPLPQEKIGNQTKPLEQNLTPPKWLNRTFKIWAVIGFLTVSGAIILTGRSLLVLMEIISESTEIIFVYSSVLYGFYAALFILILIATTPFWGAFKLRKWVIPLLFILSLFSIINVFASLFIHPFQPSSIFFTILWSSVLTILTVLAFTFRRYFTGTFWKPVPQIIFFIFILPILLIQSLALFFPDLPDINDGDMVLHDVTLPPNEGNAFFTLIGMDGEVREPTKEARDQYDQFLEGKVWDPGGVGAILAENEDVLDKMRRSSIYPYYQCPSMAENITINTELCPLGYLRAAARVASLSALSRAHEGDYEGAIDDALLPIHIGQLLIDAPRLTLIDYLVGIAMKNIGLKTLHVVLMTHEVPSEILLPQIGEMEKYIQNEDGLKNAFKVGYMSGKDALSFFHKVDSNFYLQPNRSFTKMAEDARQNVKLSDTQCYQLAQAVKDDEVLFQKRNPKIMIWQLPFMRNAIFEFIRSNVVASLHTVQTKRCETTALSEQIRFKMALAAYKYDKGEYPASQSSLIPNYILKPILNPLNNEVFMFNKDTGEIL